MQPTSRVASLLRDDQNLRNNGETIQWRRAGRRASPYRRTGCHANVVPRVNVPLFKNSRRFFFPLGKGKRESEAPGRGGKPGMVSVGNLGLGGAKHSFSRSKFPPRNKGAHQGGQATLRFLEGFLEGSLTLKVLLRRHL